MRETYIMRNFMNNTLSRMYQNDESKEDEMGGASSIHGKLKGRPVGIPRSKWYGGI
jgi:hypothetical protein